MKIDVAFTILKNDGIMEVREQKRIQQTRSASKE